MKEFIKVLFRIFFKILFRVKVINPQVVPLEGPVVLCANHLGGMDMFFIGYKIKKRIVHYMAKVELFKIPIIGRLIRWLGAFPVKRGTADLESIKTALKLLKDGHILGILPEGTRTLGKDLSKVRIKPGAALLAIRSQAPILPVALEGNYRIFSKVRVTFGEPFKLDADPDKKYTSAELSEMSKEIMKKVYALMEDNPVGNNKG